MWYSRYKIKLLFLFVAIFEKNMAGSAIKDRQELDLKEPLRERERQKVKETRTSDSSMGAKMYFLVLSSLWQR